MNSRHLTIRTLLSAMGPRRAESYVMAFDLRPDEALYIIEREVHNRSIQEIAEKFNVSPETVKRRRKSGFEKIYTQIS